MFELFVLWQRCAVCGKSGATAGCSLKHCSKKFHYYCAIESTSSSDKSKRVMVEWHKHQGTISYLYVVIIYLSQCSSGGYTQQHRMIRQQLI